VMRADGVREVAGERRNTAGHHGWRTGMRLMESLLVFPPMAAGGATARTGVCSSLRCYALLKMSARINRDRRGQHRGRPLERQAPLVCSLPLPDARSLPSSALVQTCVPSVPLCLHSAPQIGSLTEMQPRGIVAPSPAFASNITTCVGPQMRLRSTSIGTPVTRAMRTKTLAGVILAASHKKAAE
jgi:hypothetical protein